MTPRRRGPAVSPSVRFSNRLSHRLSNRLWFARRPLSAAVVAASAVAISGGLVGCVQDPAPFDPRVAQQWEKRSLDTQRNEPLKVLPDVPQTKYQPGGTTRPDVAAVTRAQPRPEVRMTLREVIHRAVANNLDVRVAGFDTAIDQTRVMEAEAAFDPQFFSTISFERVDKVVGGQEVTTVRQGVNVNSNNISTPSGASLFTPDFINRVDKEALTNFTMGIRQNLSSGGQVTLQQQVANDWYYPARGLYNPYYQNDLTLQLQQPLLQNFGTAVNQARITIARNSQRISLLEFRKTTEETVLKIEQAYWQLRQTERDVQTDRQLVQLSEDTSRLLYERLRAGQDVTSADLNQANAQTDARRVDLIAQEARLGDLSDQLKQLMNDPSFPVSGAVRLTPADDFLSDPLQFDVDDMVEAALANRYELGEQQVRIDSAEIAVDVARNGLLPSLTLNLSADVDGLSRTFPGAWNSEGNFNHDGFSTALQFQLPIGNRAARAIFQRALLQRMQAIASYGSEVEKVTADVRASARAIDTAWKRLYASHNSVLLYQQTLRDLKARIESGNQPLTFEFVFNLLQVQEQQAGSERAEHQAQNDYNYAIAQLEQAKGTLLRYDNVVMEQEQFPFDLQLPGEPDPRPTPPGYPYPDRIVGPLGR